jgi:uncharacterized protein (TIGR03067 family)
MRAASQTACVVAALLALPTRADDPAKVDRDRLQGAWEVVAWEWDGRSSRPEAGDRVVIRGDTITFTRGGKEVVEWFALAPGEDPKQIDLTPVVPPPDRLPGIYKLDGDDLVLCYAFTLGRAPARRPTEFQTWPRTCCQAVTLRRVTAKSAAPPNRAADTALIRTKLERVKEGMTREEVIAAVGAPPGDYSTRAFFGPTTSIWPTHGVEKWVYDDTRLMVQFRDGRTLIVRVERPFPPPYRPRRP